METRPLKLVLAEDIEKLLDAIGLLEAVRSGEVRCVRCGRIVAADDVSRIEATKSSYDLTCGADSCIELSRRSEGVADANR
jgi:hypothetical protein